MRKTYTGITQPERDFEELRPAVNKLSEMMLCCKPFSEEYVLLMEARQAIQKAARHFTGNQHIYASQGTSSAHTG